MSSAEEWVKDDNNLARLATDFYAMIPGKDPWEEEGDGEKPKPMDPPTEGFIKEGGWGANQDPKVWKVAAMKDKPNMFKVVDDADKNVATDFTNEENAQYYIDYYQWLEQNPEPEPEPPEPGPEPTGELDKEGVLMLYPTKQGSKEYYTKDYSYKRSSHGQASKPELGKIPRDTFTLTNVDFMQGEYTFIGKIDFTNPDDFSFKIGSLGHSGNDPNGEGQCYSLGISSIGTVHMSKETPRHPKTPNFDKHVKVEPGMPKSLGKISNKTFGCKSVMKFIDDGKNVLMEVYVDMDPLDAQGKPKNNWKKWFTAKDDGTWENKPQTFFAKGKTQTLYHRIDNVGAKTEMKYASARAI
jgi:hypothetical protein